MKEYQRIFWIDNLKGIGVIFIIFGHSISCLDFLINYLFSFHVPLFFFIAGLNFNERSLNNFRLFCIKRAKRLLVPYVFFNLISYVLWLSRVKLLNIPQEVPAIKPLVGVLYGNGNGLWLIHNTPLWFFVCLFIAQIMLFMILRIAKSKSHLIVLLFVFAAIGYLDSKYLNIRLPWSIDIAFTAVVFSGIGYIFKRYSHTYRTNNNIIILFVVLMLSLTVVYFNGKIDMNYNKFNNIFLFYSGAFLGIFFWFNISVMVGRLSIFRYIGNNSLTIFALHIPALIIIVKLMMVMGIPYSVQSSNILFLFIHSILTILIIAPFNYILNRYIPFFAGTK